MECVNTITEEISHNWSMLNGLDDIGLTMANMESIRAFEQVRSAHFPWLDGATTRVPKPFAVDKRRGRTSGGRAERVS
eukprot:COSAG05_NODE_6031_length_1038_cov_1.251331_1_plen_78_part_00